MKKIYLLAITAMIALSGNAQQKVSISTYQGTNIEKYVGQDVNVNVSRHVFHGWNTLSLPFDMTASEVEDAFGFDCRLEKLVGVESEGSTMTLNFQDCKAGGIKANTPYILYVTGDTRVVNISKTASLKAGKSMLSFTDANSGVRVTMNGAQKQTENEGLYGILVRDNSEAAFTNVSNVAGGFLATRCFLTLSDSKFAILKTNHIEANGITAINAVASPSETIDVYSISGSKVASGIKAADFNNLQKGVYVVKGRKVSVK